MCIKKLQEHLKRMATNTEAYFVLSMKFSSHIKENNRFFCFFYISSSYINPSNTIFIPIDEMSLSMKKIFCLLREMPKHERSICNAGHSMGGPSSQTTSRNSPLE
ncbi:hypothetical protein AVEN_180231-1 [Araneus ventricosus]|uniref:Uncharacterized protein n=1 Tax=Araneus ventricosus TaxID=182803 RepID=A0A4Y2VC45_ARAVE|nr:hypothetical protein AVEN_180231-1 [Araneus ventricosus]